MTKEIHALFRPIRNEYSHLIIRYILNKDTLCFPVELENLLEIKHFCQTHLNSLSNQYEKLSVCLIETHIEDYGDYDYDDDYIPDDREESTYIPIQYNPITGERFEIVIDGVLNKQKEYDEIIQELNGILEMPSRTKSQQRRINQLSDECNLFYQDLYVCDEEYQEYLKKSTKLLQCEHCLYQKRKQCQCKYCLGEKEENCTQHICEKGHCINCKDICEDFRRVQLVYLTKDLYEADGRIEPENNSTHPIKKLHLKGNNIYPLIKRDNGIVEIYSGNDTLKIPEKVFFENFMML